MNQDAIAVDFVRKHFSAKVCTYFCPLKRSCLRSWSEKEACHCGGTKADHDFDCEPEGIQYATVSATDDSPEPWKEERHLKRTPTNAFGKVHFRGEEHVYRKPAKYVRLTDDSDISSVLDLMVNYWRLGGGRKPELVLSLRGGGKLFYMLNSKKREIYDRGIINAITTTNGGWLFTFGARFGIARVVGDAVRNAQAYEFDDESRIRRRIQCVGIAEWRSVRNREYLITNSKTMLNEAPYRVDTRAATGEPSSLDPNHTHFLLVDGGTRMRERGETDNFRTRLEQRIASQEPDGLGIPVVCVFVEGGSFAIESFCNSLDKGLPIVVCEDTGRAADVLAFVIHKLDSEVEVSTIEETLKKRIQEIHWLKDDKEYVASLAKRVCISCIRHRQLVRVVNISKSEDLSVAILLSLMGGRKLDVPRQTPLDNLRLALRWNRVEVARIHIEKSRSTRQINSLDLVPCFTEALLANKLDFVQLFIDVNFRVNIYLTVAQLRELYAQSLRDRHYLDLILRAEVPQYKWKRQGDGLLLSHIHEMVRRFTRRFSPPKYADDTVNDKNESTFEEPFNELCFFCVLTGRCQAAEYFWELSEAPLLAAVVATLLCRRIIDRLDEIANNTKDEFVAMNKNFETLAVDLLEQAFKNNRSKALALLRRPLPSWSGCDVLALAALANDMTFLATECCQLAIFTKWKDGFSAGAWRILLATVTIFPVPYAITFDIDQERQRTVLTRSREATAQLIERSFHMQLKAISSLNISTAAVENDQKRAFLANGSETTDIRCVRFIDATPCITPKSAEVVQSAPVSTKFQSLETAHRKAPPLMDKRSWSGFEMQQPAVGENEFGQRKRCGGGLEDFGRKLCIFYTAPAVKFAYHTLWYIAFLFLYSYVVLFSFRWNVTAAETVLYVWQFSLICEEFRVIFSFAGHTVSEKIQDWWTFSSFATWNRIDVVILVAGAIGFILRWFHATFEVARLILTLNLIMFLTRLLKVYFVNRYLGPKVVMIRRMAWDLAMFLLVLIVFMLAYSIVSQALLYPNRAFYPRIFWDLFNHGIWELFGELRDEITGHGGHNATHCEINETSHPFECDVRWWPAPILLAAYLFFGNILMVNMLIAIFSHVFNDVQAHALEIWKYQMYFLVEEFRRKPMLPPPLILVLHAWRLLKMVVHCLRRKKLDMPSLSAQVKTSSASPEKAQIELLSAFERVCRDAHLSGKKLVDGSSTECQIRDMHQKITEYIAAGGQNTVVLQDISTRLERVGKLLEHKEAA